MGRLVFETLRGVRGHLQTEAAAVLRLQLELLGSARLPAELVQQALSTALLAAARHLHRDNSAPVWTELWVRHCQHNACPTLSLSGHRIVYSTLRTGPMEWLG